MAVNKYKPHIVIISEDQANLEILNGFLSHETVNQRSVGTLPPSGGWGRVLAEFEKNQITALRRHHSMYVVMLVDFDKQVDRLARIKGAIPDDLESRVFLLGSINEPEDLRKELGSFEKIGRSLATDCQDNTSITWGNDLLKHNAPELHRMMPVLKPILFP